MDVLGSEWMFPLVILLLGLAIGFVVGRNNNVDMKAQNKLSEQLLATQEELAEYKEKVALHFADTAAAVNAMTDSYRRVHQELSKGAQVLCDDPDTAESLLALEGSSTVAIVSESVRQPMVRPPMDYAPKPADSDAGTLDESFGLNDGQSVRQPPYDIPVKPTNSAS